MSGSVGIKIMYTKKISQGNASMHMPDLYLGNFAYLVGLIFILLSIFILLNCIKRD
jgi:hypothetical protein